MTELASSQVDDLEVPTSPFIIRQHKEILLFEACCFVFCNLQPDHPTAMIKMDYQINLLEFKC